MTALSISGGATKLAALYGTCKSIDRDFKVYAGISAGAIIAPFLAIDKDITDVVLNVEQKDIFKVVPKFGLRNIWRLIRGKSLGDQSNLIKLIKKNYTPEDHLKLIETKKKVYVGVVDFDSKTLDGALQYYNITHYSYDSAVYYIYASACIPFFTEGVKVRGKMLYDGGVCSHIPSPFIADKFGSKLDELVSVFSRPDTVKLKEYNQGRGIEGLERTLEIMTLRLSKFDERVADEECEDNGVRHTKVFMPYKLTEETYPVSKDLFKAWYEIGESLGGSV